MIMHIKNIVEPKYKLYYYNLNKHTRHRFNTCALTDNSYSSWKLSNNLGITPACNAEIWTFWLLEAAAPRSSAPCDFKKFELLLIHGVIIESILQWKMYFN